jgi:hypothetical protein
LAKKLLKIYNNKNKKQNCSKYIKLKRTENIESINSVKIVTT